MVSTKLELKDNTTLKENNLLTSLLDNGGQGGTLGPIARYCRKGPPSSHSVVVQIIASNLRKYFSSGGGSSPGSPLIQ